MSPTLLELTTQWTNPSDISTVLMVIGGDVVQKALAQSAGTWLSPVCFSFGWVAYTFMALMAVLGDGRLLPAPDHPVRVFNLKTGYVRDNRHWGLGRVVRDHERRLARDMESHLSGNGIRIAVFEATSRGPRSPNSLPWGRTHAIGLLVMIAQLVIAAIPWILSRDWGVFLVTAGATSLALWFGALTQWRVEKFPNRQCSQAVYALTSGNGARDVMVIKGMGRCLDLEEMATTDSPRNGGPWEKMYGGDAVVAGPKVAEMGETGTGQRAATGDFLRREGSFGNLRRRRYIYGMPRGFLSTLLTCIAQSILWLLLLITMGGLKANAWYLVAVGGLGMFQNGILAAMERRPEHRGLQLRRIDLIRTKKVMDGLMDLHVKHGVGKVLLPEFFPGALRENERLWWDSWPRPESEDDDRPDNRKPYDDQRVREQLVRGPPRSRTQDFSAILPKAKVLRFPAQATSTGRSSALSAHATSTSMPGSPRFSKPGPPSPLPLERGGTKGKGKAVKFGESFPPILPAIEEVVGGSPTKDPEKSLAPYEEVSPNWS